ncbi:MAG: tandem-95 repeat protein [Planctomycetota bacterium]|nr:MAG: tandem-95 repeat protein [Planctomycetota bacterium]
MRLTHKILFGGVCFAAICLSLLLAYSAAGPVAPLESTSHTDSAQATEGSQNPSQGSHAPSPGRVSHHSRGSMDRRQSQNHTSTSTPQGPAGSSRQLEPSTDTDQDAQPTFSTPGAEKIRQQDRIIDHAVIDEHARPDEVPRNARRQITLVERPGFKYPLLRREEIVRLGDVQEGEKAIVRERRVVRESVADHLAVRLYNADQLERILADHADEKLALRRHLRHMKGVVLVSFPTDDLERFTRLQERLSQHPAVAWVSADDIIYPSQEPDDPEFPVQWGLHNTGQESLSDNNPPGTPGADIDAKRAWELTDGSSAVIIAVVDTGVDYAHEDLAANMWNNPDPDAPDRHGYDFYDDDPSPMDSNGHGTHVAGTIGAIGNNGIGVTGVNWQCQIMALRIFGPEGTTASKAADALHYAVDNGAHIVNNSWGGTSYSPLLRAAVEYGNDNNVLMVMAAGNTSNDNDITPIWPASLDFPNVISVAATNRNDHLARFSNFGQSSVHLAAPGVEIVSTFPGNDYRQGSGTSMAAPHVTGVAGLLAAYLGPGAPIAHIRQAILDNVDPVDTLLMKVATGGRLNAFASLSAIIQNPFSGHARLSFDDSVSGNGDGWINPGETIDATLHISNYSDASVSDLQAILRVISGAEYINLDKDTFAIPELSSGGNYDLSNVFQFTVVDHLSETPQTVTFELLIYRDDHTWTREIEVSIRDVFTLEGRVLLDGQPFSEESVRVYYRGPSTGWIAPDSDGYYSISLPQGIYEVHAALKEYHPEEWLGDWTYRSPWQMVEGFVTGNVEHNIPWRTGRMHGRVTGFPNNGIADVHIKTEWEFPWIALYYEEGPINTPYRYHHATTGEDGYYELPMIIPEGSQALLNYVTFAHPLYERDPGAQIWGGSWSIHPDLELNHTLRSIGIEARPRDLTIIAAPNTISDRTVSFYNTGNQESRYYFTDTMPYYEWQEIDHTWIELGDGLGQAVGDWDYDESVYDDEGNFARHNAERKKHTISLGFSMPYYQGTVHQAHVHSAGWLSFSMVDPNLDNKIGIHLLNGVPLTPENHITLEAYVRSDVIAPLWVLWGVDSEHYLEGLYYHQPDDETMIIQWDRRIDGSTYSYQTWLHADGRIHFVYHRTPAPSFAGFIGYAGISDRWCLRGITIDSNNASNGSWTRAVNGTTIAFTPRRPWLSGVPNHALIQPEGWLDIPLRIDTTGMEVGDYRASIYAMLPRNRYMTASWVPNEEVRLLLKVRELDRPEADAGPDRIVRLGEAVTLDGSASTGPNYPLSYQWEQIGGAQALPLTGADSAQPILALDIDALESGDHFGTYTFRLTVSDGEQSSTDTVQVEVKGSNIVLHKPVIGSSPTRYTTRPIPFNLLSDLWWALPNLQAITDGWITRFTVSFWAGEADPDRSNRIWFEIDLQGTYYINQARIDYLYGSNQTQDRWLEYRDSSGSWQRLTIKYNRMNAYVRNDRPDWMGPRTDFPPLRNESAVATAVRMVHETNQSSNQLLISSLELYGMRLTEYDTEPNMAPVAYDANYSVEQESTLDLELQASDEDGDHLIYRIAQHPSNGTLHGQPPHLLYRPDSAFYGEDSFSFTAHDGKALSNVATVNITVTPVNHPPIAVADRVWIRPGETARVEVLVNDRDRDGDPLTVIDIGSPSHGTASHDGRVVRYTPDEGWEGLDVFLYTISDGRGGEASAQIQIYTGDPLLAHLPLLDDADDITLYEHHGSLEDGAAIRADAGFTDAGALHIDGDDQALSIASDGSLTDSPIRRRSVAFWMRLDRLVMSGREQVLYQEGDASDPEKPFLQLALVDQGRLRGHISDPSWDAALRHPTLEYGPLAQEWQHVALVFDGENPDTPGSLDLYIDGEHLDRVSVGNVLSARNGAVLFANDAQRQQATLGHFNDLRIYDWALTAAEVVALARNPGGEIENTAPTAYDLSLSVERNHSVSFTLPGSDPDPADILVYDIIEGPTRGDLAVFGDQAIYTPHHNYVGEDEIRFVVSDGRAESNVGIVSITVLGLAMRRITMDNITGMWFWVHLDGAGTRSDSGDGGHSIIDDLDPESEHILVPAPEEPQ